jgi:lysophospholipase L1-like esterase
MKWRSEPVRRALRHTMQGAAVAAMLLPAPARAADPGSLPCAPFTAAPLARPVARFDANSRARRAAIAAEIAARRYRILFFGDSITQRWDPIVWRRDMAPRGVLNAGINGDRTEHLIWRLDHGELSGPAPEGVALLIGTNDLGHGRPPALAAEGIRAVLLVLRRHLPHTPILLLGLWPRAAAAGDRLRRAVGAVNRLIARCGDGHSIVYADLGGVLLEPDGTLSRAISPDRLHFSRRGYERLAPGIDGALDRLARRP